MRASCCYLSVDHCYYEDFFFSLGFDKAQALVGEWARPFTLATVMPFGE
jgi:hypothetical protein